MKNGYTTKESPIIFNTEMVRAITEGRKTQTRRVIKKQPDDTVDKIERAAILDGTNRERFMYQNYGEERAEAISCPYGQKGDLIWVRESFAKVPSTAFPKSEGMDAGDGYHYHFRAGWDRSPIPWKPSIHMPKNAARIWLRVKDVRIERVKGISDADALAEGIKFHKPVPGDGGPIFNNYAPAKPGHFSNNTLWNAGIYHNHFHKAIDSFRSLWHSIIGPESWEENPWIWVIEFEVLSVEGKPLYWPDKQLRIDEESERATQKTNTGAGIGKVYIMPESHFGNVPVSERMMKSMDQELETFYKKGGQA
jgi:hypothetical protein